MTDTTRRAAVRSLPGILREHEDELTAALAWPLLMTWDKKQPFREAEQAREIGNTLVSALHDHLFAARIGYIFREKIAKRERTVLAQASKVSGKLGYFSNHLFEYAEQGD